MHNSKLNIKIKLVMERKHARICSTQFHSAIDMRVLYNFQIIILPLISIQNKIIQGHVHISSHQLFLSIVEL